ncbi:carboxy terminal-processing peptidase [Niabella insulamsoli]|uniref:carboxy terminal-processing peptidase n=1 Tax=Niabella insulamsoli TaxID=3144874 RepID=UPI0031FDA893
MKRLPFLILLIVVAGSFFAFKNKWIANDSAAGKYELIMTMVSRLLSQAHYDPKTINDDFSEKVFYKYLEDLDPKKNIFLKRDVDSLAGLYADRIDDELNGAEVASFLGVSAVFDRRIAESEAWKNLILDQPFDFTLNEEVQLDGHKIDYPASQQERKDRWRKWMKYYALEIFVNLEDDKSKASRSKTQLEKEARERTDTIMTRLFDRYKVKLTEEDKFNLFVDNITTAMDPHTEFFPPADKRYFDEELSGSFYGIGAGLQYSEGLIKIISINVGSPAAKSGELAPGDIITKVAQGKEGEAVDMLGYDVQDAVKIIRGKEGTTVRLTIKKPDGTVKEVALVRARIDNDIDTYARSAILKDSAKGTKIGIIYLPEFYTPTYQDPNGRRSYTDVAREVQKLKDEKVDGIIMDLRRNGGGSLYDVVQMVGLFIKDGPIVQVKDRFSQAQVLKDEDHSVLYTGPLAVMVDEFSASASEIFAAAIQDYKRGVIIGSTSTYGKGTVQQNIGLDHSGLKRDGDGDLGAVKLTLRKFYRVSGGSTQLKGVESDIVLPSQIEPLKLREKDNEYALKYDEIGKSNYTPWNSQYDINTLKQLSNDRLQRDSSFQIIKRNSAWLASENERSYPLNINAYKAEKKVIKAKSDQIIAAQKLQHKMRVGLLPLELDKYENDKNKQERLKQWVQSLSSDIYLKQAGEVMDDMIVEAKNFALSK